MIKKKKNRINASSQQRVNSLNNRQLKSITLFPVCREYINKLLQIMLIIPT